MTCPPSRSDFEDFITELSLELLEHYLELLKLTPCNLLFHFSLPCVILVSFLAVLCSFGVALLSLGFLV